MGRGHGSWVWVNAVVKTGPAIACVASVSSRGSSRKLGQEQKNE